MMKNQRSTISTDVEVDLNFESEMAAIIYKRDLERVQIVVLDFEEIEELVKILGHFAEKVHAK